MIRKIEAETSSTATNMVKRRNLMSKDIYHSWNQEIDIGYKH